MKSETYDGPLRELRLGRLQHRSIELRLRHFSRRISTFPWPFYASRLVRHRNVRPSLCHHPSTAELARDFTQHRLGLLRLSLAYRFNTCVSRLARWYGIGPEQNGTGIESVKFNIVAATYSLQHLSLRSLWFPRWVEVYVELLTLEASIAAVNPRSILYIW